MSDERCRLCTANDRDAVVKELAVKLWDGHRGRIGKDDAPWDEAGGYWWNAFEQVASDALEILGRP